MMLRLFWWAWLAFYTRHIVAFTATDVDKMVILDDLVRAVSVNRVGQRLLLMFGRTLEIVECVLAGIYL